MNGRVVAKRLLIGLVGRVPRSLVLRTPTRWLRSFLARALDARIRLRAMNYEVDTRYGFRFSGNTGDLIQRYVYAYGVWEPRISEWAARHLREGDAVLDVGANAGYFSLLAAARVGPTGTVIAVEPMSAAWQLLQENVRINAFRNVKMVRAIASDHQGSGAIYRAESGNLGQSTTMPRPGFTGESDIPVVATASLVEAELLPRLRLIKIDTEGDELSVLRGLGDLLGSLPSDAAILAEVSPEWLASRGQSAEDLLGLMASHGFRPYVIGNEYSPLYYLEGHSEPPKPLAGPVPPEGCDILFTR